MANQSLIQGARYVAQSKSLLQGAGTKAFISGVTKELERKRQQVELEKKEKEERESIVNSYLDKLGSLQNIEKLGDHNKAKITEWALNKKDEYARAVDCYTRTKDRGCRENMEKIFSAFRNLESQINAFDEDQIRYLKAKENNSVVEIPGKGEKYSYLFTDNGIMGVENNGDLGFSINGEDYKYRDIAGGYTINNYEYGTYILKAGRRLGAAVKKDPNLPLDIVFDKNLEKNTISTNLETTGTEGIMAAALFDYNFDDNYQLPDGSIAGDMTFEGMFKSGVLADKFYDGTLTGEVYGTKKEGVWDLGENGTNWFWDAGNSSKLKNLISEYSTDVLENQTQLELQKYANLPPGSIYEADYMKASRLNSDRIDIALKSFDINDLQKITMKGYEIIEQDGEIGIRRVYDGTWMDTLDPNNKVEARNMLYKYAGTRDQHKRFPSKAQTKGNEKDNKEKVTW